MTDPTPPVATVVVAVKGDHRIRRLLDALLRQDMAAGSLEVLVVENGSDLFADVDGLGGGMVRYLHAVEANSAAARNLGLREARGRYLLSTDADCVPDRSWARSMVQALDAGPCQVVGGTIRKHAPATWVQRHAITIVDGQQTVGYLPALHLPYVVGASAGYHTDAVRAAGGFDDRLKSGADVDICYRLGLRGQQVGLVPDAVVEHTDRATLRGHFHRFRVYAVYQVLLFRLYRPVSGRRWIINPYPLRRTAATLGLVPRALVALAGGDGGLAARVLVQLVEVAGIWCGDIQGSVRWRVLYL
ncbi:MAG: glycosyltransferase [Micromonosporaceae bacterium]|nr:glycosyltransferase [Micromonosporaceae bacterium]